MASMSSRGIPRLTRSYRSATKNASAKNANQKKWLTEAGLTPGEPQLLAITEATTDDGMATLLPALDHLFESGARLAILGRVSPQNLAGMEFARRRHAGRLSWLPDYDESHAPPRLCRLGWLAVRGTRGTGVGSAAARTALWRATYLSRLRGLAHAGSGIPRRARLRVSPFSRRLQLPWWTPCDISHGASATSRPWTGAVDRAMAA